MTTTYASLAAIFALLALPILPACQTAEEEFVDGRLKSICDEAYWVCNVPTGCVLDDDRYVEGRFPGDRRVVVETDAQDADVQVRLFFSTMQAPGTELLVQLHDANCTLDPQLGRAHLKDVDIFHEAGDDRVLIFDLTTQRSGEHLLEIYSDASAEYLLVVEQN